MVANDELDQYLKEKFTSAFRKGYVTVKGVSMPLRYLEMQEDIDKWDVNEDDVWICSFPKTGTTWTQEMVWMIINNLDFEEGKVNLGHRSPFLEVSAVFDFRDMKKENPEFQPPPFLDDSLAFVKSQKSPLCIKTHLPFCLLPEQIQNRTKRPKIIYVTRNAKDTCISYYHHCRLMEGYTGDFEHFYRLFLAGKLNFSPYWEHVLSFWERRHFPNILFIKYEDMKKDLKKVIRQVADFLERPLSPEQVDILNKHLSFEAMKQNPAVNYEMVIELSRKFKLTECDDGEFMRSGTVGTYKAVMTGEIVSKFDRWELEHTQGTDYQC